MTIEAQRVSRLVSILMYRDGNVGTPDSSRTHALALRTLLDLTDLSVSLPLAYVITQCFLNSMHFYNK